MSVPGLVTRRRRRGDPGAVAGRAVLAGIGWIVAAAAAATFATAALDTLGGGLLAPTVSPLSPGEVDRELAGRSPTPAQSGIRPSPCPSCDQPTPSRASTAAPATRPPRTASPIAGGTRSLTVPAGSVVARCANDLAQLLSWSPAPGYRVTGIDAGPAAVASLTFRAGGEESVAWWAGVTCTNGVPQVISQPSGDGDD